MDISKICRKVNLEFPEALWCHICDEEIINSDDPSTGTFYGISGHIITRDNTLSGQWPTVCFAICKNCEKENS